MNVMAVTKEDVRDIFANDLNIFLSQLQIETNGKNEMEKLRQISFLIDELLKCKDLKKQFENIIQDKSESKIKIQFLSAVRNILAHFPIYNKWEEIYLNEQIVQWNRKSDGEIKKFFSEENIGKEFSYIVYVKRPFITPENKFIIKIKIPSIQEGFFLQDVISIKDFKLTLYLIDHLLESIGIETQSTRGYSI
ncbi:MAG: hypothetical protein PHF21_00010 [Bacilli bacterium]|nr:hypothetical protein [Bacilli bacterium]